VFDYADAIPGFAVRPLMDVGERRRQYRTGARVFASAFGISLITVRRSRARTPHPACVILGY
jgi:hypothetical protein